MEQRFESSPNAFVFSAQDDVLEPIEFNLYKKARHDETCRRGV